MIRYPAAFWNFLPDGHDGVFDWDYLKDIWRGRIEPMDFDCVVERNGMFLCIETKEPGVALKEGQLRTFHRLLQDPKWTLILVYGKLPETVNQLSVYRNGREIRHIPRATKDDMRRECDLWRSEAEMRKAPFLPTESFYIGRRSKGR